MLTRNWDRPVLDRFIVFEGLDGAGTTTQARQLAHYLATGDKSADGDPPRTVESGEVTLTFEPTDRPIGRTIREILYDSEPVTPWALALLYAADRQEHIEHPTTGIRALIAAGKHVVCDRYLFSSLAYQGGYADFASVESLNYPFPLPEHLIFIDTPRIEAERRMQQRAQRDRLETDAVQTRVEQMYRQIIKEFDQTTKVTVHWIDGSLSVDDIFDQICRQIGR